MGCGVNDACCCVFLYADRDVRQLNKVRVEFPVTKYSMAGNFSVDIEYTIQLSDFASPPHLFQDIKLYFHTDFFYTHLTPILHNIKVSPLLDDIIKHNPLYFQFRNIIIPDFLYVRIDDFSSRYDIGGWKVTMSGGGIIDVFYSTALDIDGISVNESLVERVFEGCGMLVFRRVGDEVHKIVSDEKKMKNILNNLLNIIFTQQHSQYRVDSSDIKVIGVGENLKPMEKLKGFVHSEEVKFSHPLQIPPNIAKYWDDTGIIDVKGELRDYIVTVLLVSGFPEGAMSALCKSLNQSMVYCHCER